MREREGGEGDRGREGGVGRGRGRGREGEREREREREKKQREKSLFSLIVIYNTNNKLIISFTSHYYFVISFLLRSFLNASLIMHISKP